MLQARFRDPSGSVRVGEWTDGGLAFAGRTFTHEEVDILPPSTPSKIVCVGRNYVEHVEEFNNPMPDRPLLFLKGPNTLAGHHDTVSIPSGKQVDYEAELGVVIDQQCRNVPASEAMNVVAGYTCGNDLSNRDDQREEQNWVRGKAFDGAAPIGPVLATTDEVPDDAYVRSRVNGEARQDGSLDLLIFSIPELIEEITTLLTLEAGDVILTGTPEGVGPLEDGDTVEIEVEGIPPLVHDIEVDSS